jgi:hypothetical protein
MLKGETNTGSNMEKRKSDRHFLEARLVCGYFNTNQYYHAKMLNYCDGGLYFASEFAFKPEASIYIRIEEFSQRTSGSSLRIGYRTVTLAEVKRCEEISGTECYRYGIGVRYYQPY